MERNRLESEHEPDGIVAGARTLNGALVPLVGTAPTNFNFVAGDYNRKTGLVGDGSTKYLNSNRNNNADPLNSVHISVYSTTAGTSSRSLLAAIQVGSSITWLRGDGTTGANTTGSTATVAGTFLGLYGVSRDNASNYSRRFDGSTATVSLASNATSALSYAVFVRNVGGSISEYTTARLSFYSIGEALDLALLDARLPELLALPTGDRRVLDNCLSYIKITHNK